MVIEMKRISTVFALVLALVWGAACGNGTTTPTTPTTGVATSFTQVMSGDIAPGATPVHTFSVPGTAPLHMMLGSLLGADGLPLGSTVTLVYGVPSTDGLTCTALTKVSTPVALQAQINVTASSGGYCVGLEDTGSVADATHYAIRVIYGTPSDETSAGSFDHAYRSAGRHHIADVRRVGGRHRDHHDDGFRAGQRGRGGPRRRVPAERRHRL